MEDVIATAARLSALVSVASAVRLALSDVAGQGGGFVALVGWIGVALLVAGLVFGVRGSITVAAVTFILRHALAGLLPVEATTPLWIWALLIVLMIEFGTASFTFRSRPVDPVHIVGRALVMGLAATGITLLLGALTGVTEAGGILVRAVGVAALVVAGGWVTWTWRRSGLTGQS
jgi:hypothetical protein